MPSKSDCSCLSDLPGNRRLDELERRRRRTGQRQQLRHALALVHAARFGADLGVGASEQRVVLRQIDRRACRFVAARSAGPPKLPRK